MDPGELSTVAAILGSMSVVVERVVEIVKKFRIGLDQEGATDSEERRRQLKLLGLSSLTGVVVAAATAGLLQHVGEVQSMFGKVWDGERLLAVIAFGLLSAGGSGLWNSVAGYANKLKALTTERVERERVSVRIAKVRRRSAEAAAARANE